MSPYVLCKFCSSVWLIRSPEGRFVLENGTDHNCRLAPWNLKRDSKMRARAYKKEQLRAIDDYALLAEIRDKMRYWQSRLVNYKLDYSVEPKRTEEEESKR